LEQPGTRDKLVDALGRLAEFLHSLDRTDDAVAACQEAATIHREGCSYEECVDTLWRMANFLQMVGRLPEACSHYRDAVGMCRELWHPTSTEFSPRFGEALRKLADSLRVSERVDEAYAVEKDLR